MTARTIGGGFAYKVCDCEDAPCCGHNDVDPGWSPDPYDEWEMSEDPYDPDEWCVGCELAPDDCTCVGCDCMK